MERLYLGHFGLQQSPFSITPDPHFFYDGSGRGDLLRAIEYSVRHQEGIVVVSGEVGSGKTMLCRTLLARLHRDIESIYVANPRLKQREMLATLLRDLGEPAGGDPNAALQNALLQRCLAGQRVVLFADEAHAMPRESLEQIRLLTNLETGRRKLLQIVLFGQPELNEVLAGHDMRPLRDRIVERFAVSALPRAATAEYLAFRMARAGRSGNSGFGRDAVGALWQGAAGLVRRINLLADKALLSAFGRGGASVTRGDVQRAISDIDGTAPPERVHPAAYDEQTAASRAGSLAARALLIAAAGVVAACAPQPPRPSDAHLLRTEVPAQTTAAIPAPARGSLDLPPPQEQTPPERYTLVVNNMPVPELLFTLARDAKLNVDVHPDVKGNVSINAIDQTLAQILNRIATQVDMRYTLEGNLLSVVPDTPFVRVYRVDYLNMGRDTTSRTAIATHVATTGGTGQAAGAGGGSEGAAGNNSGAELVNTSKNQFWQSLIDSLKALLQETDKIVQDPAAMAGAGTGKDGKDKDGKPQAETGMRLREAASVIAQPETGVVAVRATARQQERVQEFLDSSVRSARRQVLIEATIAEVELADDYEQGIDWQVLRTAAANTIGLTVQPAGALTQLLGGSPVGTTRPTMGLLEFDHSKGKVDITSALRLLQSFGRTRVLSSPKISVLNNQTALIKVVDNIVYFQLTTDYTPGTGGSPTTFTVTSTPSTVPVGFLMNVTPQISANDEVVLNLRPTISRLTGFVDDPGVALSLALARQSGTTIPDVSSRVPEIQTREMESVIKISDGQIAVLGGLMREDTFGGEDAVPGAARLPLLGGLFRSNTRHNKKSELVIFLRPVIVREASLEGDYRDLAHLLPDGAFLGTDTSR
jgi:general secretion pathway protein D